MLTSIKLNLENLEEDLKKPEVTNMINNGWKIVSYVPVIDKDSPVLLVILSKEENRVLKLHNSIVKYQKRELISLVLLCIAVFTNIILTLI
tara:strand:+ start:256 stop:528 length:273 start_codon:yes stop_codon:yes gene_type:complete